VTTTVFPLLPSTTIVPEDWNIYIPYFNRLYEGIAQTVNQKDNNFYTMAITSTAVNILNVPNFGAFIICVSGSTTDLPTITASLCKASTTAAGSVTSIGSQVGAGLWDTYSLSITSTATNFQIAHNNTGVTGNFNIRIIGTQ
jgi:hypothetical protein